MRPPREQLLRIGLWAICAVLALEGAALAKVKVIQSSTPGLETNAILSETEVIDVPRDAVVIVLQIPECRALEIRGAYHGTIADYLEQRRGFWERAQSLWDRITGNGSNKSSPPVGATRGFRAAGDCG